MRPETVFSRRGFRPVGKCDWCGEDDRVLVAIFLPENAWVCLRSCHVRLERGELGRRAIGGAPFTGERPRRRELRSSELVRVAAEMNGLNEEDF
ncbi:MAG TPA: hypothetical protein PLX85_06115 [Dehalococcoidia bacterium]|nr:hypothetical protein [Dehalococcoidia bacterium]